MVNMEATHMKRKLTMKELWNKACEIENIPTDSKFVVFSDDNKYMKEYNARMGEILNRMVR
jgi:hypothetical protein